MSNIPSSRDLIDEALRNEGSMDINSLHEKVYELMILYRKEYYDKEVSKFLSRLDLADIPLEIKNRIKDAMLKPVTKEDTTYTNIMEGISRPVSQTFQVISGTVAELCAENELIKNSLTKGIHYTRRKERTDFIIYHPNIESQRKRHRVEVKNVKLRERGTRGLAFDADSMLGFFDDASEFTDGNVKIIDDHCKKYGGYCYVPPEILDEIPDNERFKSNTEFGHDMRYFVDNGHLP